MRSSRNQFGEFVDGFFSLDHWDMRSSRNSADG